MTATSLVARSQSSRDRRLPRITSMQARLSRRLRAASSLLRLLDCLAKQRMLRMPWSSRLATTREPRNPVAPVTSTRSVELMIIRVFSLRQERQDVEAIVLKLDELFGDALDPVPCVRPPLWRRLTKDGSTVNLRAALAEHGAVHERRPPAAEARRHDDHRLHVVSCEAASDLSGQIEADWLSFPDDDEFPCSESSLSGHDLGHAPADRIGHRNIPKRLNGDERLSRDSRLFE